MDRWSVGGKSEGKGIVGGGCHTCHLTLRSDRHTDRQRDGKIIAQLLTIAAGMQTDVDGQTIIVWQMLHLDIALNNRYPDIG